MNERLLDKTEGERNRGWFLTLIIFAIIVYSVLTGIEIIYQGLFEYRELKVLIYGLIFLTNIIFVIAIWKWKKWGVYGVIAVELIDFGYNFALEHSDVYDLIAFIIVYFSSLGILVFALRNRWNFFD